MASSCSPVPAAAPQSAKPNMCMPTADDAIVQPERTQAEILDSWFATARAAPPTATFGELLVRLGAAQLDAPYSRAKGSGAPRATAIHLKKFGCVSFVENTLAVARCAWLGEEHADCFLSQLQALRYRDGGQGDFAARLHYFSEWLLVNENRGLIERHDGGHCGRSRPRRFNFITRHRRRYPAMSTRADRRQMRKRERKLSRTPIAVVPRARVRSAVASLSDGDIVAVVGLKSGLLVSHTGFAMRDEAGTMRLLHASSKEGRVVLSKGTLSNYVYLYKRGAMFARPLAPAHSNTTCAPGRALQPRTTDLARR